MLLIMIKGILKGILKMILKVLNIVLIPINTLIANVFPSMDTAIQTFTNFINNVIGNNLVFFFHILPPIFRTLLFTWFTFVIAYYSIYYTYKGILKIWEIIQKIKFW